MEFAFITRKPAIQMRPPLVLIHGFASSTLVWSKVFLSLAEAGFRVIALDMLGYGYSGKTTRTANTRLRARRN